ncbi:hypothetical protein E2P47_01445 [Candidatus Bathyarchaeota archaeon]|nr:hypothetical protein E2P47_01445 [Candidatus Bathyarchaeota archaeon]
MLKSFKEVLEKEREAEKLIIEAEKKAEEIRKSSQIKSENIYNKTYQESVSEAKRKSIEIKDQARIEAESEAQIFIKNAEKMKKEIVENSKQKFDEAVNFILNEILST